LGGLRPWELGKFRPSELFDVLDYIAELNSNQK
jgi:hypothetical protein